MGLRTFLNTPRWKLRPGITTLSRSPTTLFCSRLKTSTYPSISEKPESKGPETPHVPGTIYTSPKILGVYFMQKFAIKITQVTPRSRKPFSALSIFVRICCRMSMPSLDAAHHQYSVAKTFCEGVGSLWLIFLFMSRNTARQKR